MIKSVIKFSIVFIIAVFMALGAASASYIVTKRMLNLNSTAKSDEVVSDEEKSEEGGSDFSSKAVVPDYYLVRLEGETLGVYARFSEREDFLYNAEVYKTNLSSEDIRLLSSGKIVAKCSFILFSFS